MKSLILSIVSLASIALTATPSAANPLPLLYADLDGDKRMETVRPYLTKSLFVPIDVDGDGHIEVYGTRGIPTLLCNLDGDPWSEAVVQDAQLDKAWATDAPGNLATPKLVFIRGQVVDCVPRGPSLHEVLVVRDGGYTGMADIDDDGVIDIVWEALPLQTGTSGPAQW